VTVDENFALFWGIIDIYLSLAAVKRGFKVMTPYKNMRVMHP